LRQRLYAEVAPWANAWHQMLRLPTEYPSTLEEFLAACHAMGQSRPAPLL